MNTVSIFRLIRERGPLSRPEIQEALGMSLPVISIAVGELLERGLIVPAGSVRSPVGRRPELLELNPRKGYLIGMDIGGTKTRVAIGDFKGNLVHRGEIPSLAYEGGPKLMERVVALTRSMLDANGIPLRDLLAVGVGGPGISEEKTEANLLFPYIPSWKTVPVRGILEREFGAPVLVENDVDMAVIGEHNRGAGKGCDNLVFAMIGVGVGAGIILDGKLYRGTRRAAGEIGFMVVDRDLIREEFSDAGALECTVSGPGIVKRFWARAKSRPAGCGDDGTTLEALEDRIRGMGLDAANSQAVFALAGEGNSDARQVVDETITYLGMALSNLASVLNPELIVLGGGVGLAVYSWAAERLCRFLQNHVPFTPRMSPAQLGDDAGVFGALTVAQGKAYQGSEDELRVSHAGERTRHARTV